MKLLLNAMVHGSEGEEGGHSEQYPWEISLTNKDVFILLFVPSSLHGQAQMAQEGDRLFSKACGEAMLTC